MLALWAVSTSLFSWETAFAPIESSGCCTSLAAVIFALSTVSCIWTGPYWVFSFGPVKLPEGFAGAVLGGAFGGAALDGVLAGVAGRVVAGAVGVDDAFAVFFADGAALAEPAADTAGDAGADTDSPAGVLGSATGVAPGTWVLNENSAARPATVPLRVRTARRMQPPGGMAPWERPVRWRGQKSKDSWWMRRRGMPAATSAFTAAAVMPVGPHTYASYRCSPGTVRCRCSASSGS